MHKLDRKYWERTTSCKSRIWGFLLPTLGNTCHTYY